MGGSNISERTPLLPATDTRGDTNEATPPLEAEVDTADTIGQGALEAPRFPDTSSPKPNELVNFGEDGLLAEITRSQFRFIFGSLKKI
jgi:hypothetical protein